MMLGIPLLIWYPGIYRPEQGRGQIPFDPLDTSLMSLGGISLPDDFYDGVIPLLRIAPEVLLKEFYLE